MGPPLSLRAEKVARILKTRFDADGHYFLESYVGSGIQADVFRIKKCGDHIEGPDRVAVKVPAQPELRTARSMMLPEKEALNVCFFSLARYMSFLFPKPVQAFLLITLGPIRYSRVPCT
jgi:hypothetical protein